MSLIFATLLFCFAFRAASGGPTEEATKAVLKNSYSSAKPENITEVSLGLSLNSVLEVDVGQRRTFSGNIWMKLMWKDPRLSFDPAKYKLPDDAQLRIPSSKLWIPDVTLYNAAEPFEIEDSNAVVSPDGTVLFVPQAKFQAACGSSSLRLYPVDTHRCHLKMGPWTYSGYEMKLSLMDKEVDMQAFQENPEWETKAIGTELNTLHYECCPEPYEHVLYTFEFRRKLSSSQVLLIFPGVATAFLTIAMFILPAECREKATFGAILFLSLIVMFAILCVTVPSGGAVAIVGYYAVNMAFVTLALFWHTFLILMAYPSNSSSRPHRLLRKFASGFSVISCLPNEHLDLSDDNEGEDTTLSNSAKGARNIAEWRFVARMLDRLMLICFALLLILLGVLSIGF